MAREQHERRRDQVARVARHVEVELRRLLHAARTARSDRRSDRDERARRGQRACCAAGGPGQRIACELGDCGPTGSASQRRREQTADVRCSVDAGGLAVLRGRAAAARGGGPSRARKPALVRENPLRPRPRSSVKRRRSPVRKRTRAREPTDKRLIEGSRSERVVPCGPRRGVGVGSVTRRQQQSGQERRRCSMSHHIVQNASQQRVPPAPIGRVAMRTHVRPPTGGVRAPGGAAGEAGGQDPPATAPRPWRAGCPTASGLGRTLVRHVELGELLGEARAVAAAPPIVLQRRRGPPRARAEAAAGRRRRRARARPRARRRRAGRRRRSPRGSGSAGSISIRR